MMIVDGVYFSEKSLVRLQDWQKYDGMASYYITEIEKLNDLLLDNRDNMQDGIDILHILVVLRDIKKDIATILEPSLFNQLLEAVNEEDDE